VELNRLLCIIGASITADIVLFLFCTSDRTIKFWNIEAVVGIGHTEEVVKLSSQAVVAAHDKDINSLAVAPNDSLLCSGSQVQNKSAFCSTAFTFLHTPQITYVEVVWRVSAFVLNSSGSTPAF